MDGTCSLEMRNSYRTLVRKSEWKKPFGRPRNRWENKIKMDFKEIRWDEIDWINLTQKRDQGWTLNRVMNL
jgi:hypothetical protein